MSGVYINGMEMPKACVYRKNGHLITCPLYDIDGYCGALHQEVSHKEGDLFKDCPLVHVPTPHGRLIDADALDADLERQDMHTGEWDAVGFSIEEIENAPTIIPAEEEK